MLKPCTQQDSVSQTHKAVFHIALNAGYKMNAVIQKHLKKRRRNITPVTEYFTE
jgi:hypothetical protein